MDWFKQLPHSRRSPPGLEWAVLKRLPGIWLIGTLLPGLVMAVVWWSQPADASAASQRDLWRLVYVAIGLVILHWTLVLTVAIGCAIVWIMKGPAYVADAYPLNEREHPRPDPNPPTPAGPPPNRP
jgi:hypothetical protein